MTVLEQRRLWLVVPLAGFLALAGCDTTVAPTAPVSGGPAVTDLDMSFTNGPANPGESHVMRVESHFVFAGVDPARDLLSLNGLGASDPASSVLCGGTVLPEIMSIQSFVNDDTFHGNVRGTDVTQHVWAFDGTRPPLDVICNDPPVAAGTGNFKLMDAQEFGVKGTRGWNAQGKLTDPVSGQLVHYSENQRAIIKDGQGRWVTEDIHLTWVGNTP